jgi:hypothetical protein
MGMGYRKSELQNSLFRHLSALGGFTVQVGRATVPAEFGLSRSPNLVGTVADPTFLIDRIHPFEIRYSAFDIRYSLFSFYVTPNGYPLSNRICPPRDQALSACAALRLRRGASL